MSSPAAQNADRAIGSMSRFPTTAETPAIDADHKNIGTEILSDETHDLMPADMF